MDVLLNSMMDKQQQLLMYASNINTFQDGITLLSELQKHNDLLGKALEVARASNAPINPQWEYSLAESRSIQERLGVWINDNYNASISPPTSSSMQLSAPESPVKFLTNLLLSHGELIRCVDRIQDVYGEGFKDLSISLPRIVVVGEENVGKSSVLESIAGVPVFPRAEGICTRVPFQMRIHHKTVKQMASKFQLTDDKAQSTTMVVFEDEPNKVLNNADEVMSKVSEITKQVTGGKGVVDHLIVLNVYSTQVTDLTIIDLPGIITAHRVGEPEDIYERTVALVQKYIKDEDTIILAVVPATLNLGSSQALRQVQKAKALNRAIGVITKVDLATTRDKVEQKILGVVADNVELPHGYVGVINSDTEQNQQFTEMQFFEQKYPDLVKRQVVGVQALTKKLNDLLGKHIREIWAPKTKKIIQSREEEVKRKLEDLGQPIPGSNLKGFFQRELSLFCTDFSKKFFQEQSAIFVFASQEMARLTFKISAASNMSNNNNITNINTKQITEDDSNDILSNYHKIKTMTKNDFLGKDSEATTQDVGERKNVVSLSPTTDTNDAEKINSAEEVCMSVLAATINRVEEAIMKVMSDCKISRFPNLTQQIIAHYRTCCAQSKLDIVEAIRNTASLAATNLPGVADVTSPAIREIDCAICMKSVATSDSGGVVTLYCSSYPHSFHVSCYTTYVQRQQHKLLTCPVCRTRIPNKMEKPPSASAMNASDPLTSLTLKAIWKYLIHEVQGNFALTMEAEFANVDEVAAMQMYQEAPNIVALRTEYSKQLEVLRGALIEIVKFSR